MLLLTLLATLRALPHYTCIVRLSVYMYVCTTLSFQHPRQPLWAVLTDMYVFWGMGFLVALFAHYCWHWWDSALLKDWEKTEKKKATASIATWCSLMRRQTFRIHHILYNWMLALYRVGCDTCINKTRLHKVKQISTDRIISIDLNVCLLELLFLCDTSDANMAADHHVMSFVWCPICSVSIMRIIPLSHVDTHLVSQCARN